MGVDYAPVSFELAATVDVASSPDLDVAGRRLALRLFLPAKTNSHGIGKPTTNSVTGQQHNAYSARYKRRYWQNRLRTNVCPKHRINASSLKSLYRASWYLKPTARLR